MNKLDTLENIEFKNRNKLRSWLELNHDKSQGIFVVFYKKDSGIETVKYDEAVDEALCFGWIDSKTNRIDSRRYKILFTPRKKKSIWSKVNKNKVEKLELEGKMTEAGRKVIEDAKENGYWNIYDSVDNLEVPEVFKKALSKNKKALKSFENLSPSNKKIMLWQIKIAVSSETKNKRINKFIEELNEKNNFK